MHHQIDSRNTASNGRPPQASKASIFGTAEQRSVIVHNKRIATNG